MSDTPRTDAEQDDARNMALDFQCASPPKTGNIYVVPAEFARTLERELNEANTRVDDLVVRALKRWPVMVKLYDADMKEHVFGPIIVEVEELENGGNYSDWWLHLDNEARKYLQADMTCDALEGIMALQPDGKSGNESGNEKPSVRIAQ